MSEPRDRLMDLRALAENLLSDMECKDPGGVPVSGMHCAGCCYGTGFAVSSWEEMQLARALSDVVRWATFFIDDGVDGRDRCPSCSSPSPELHPAMQHEGEVQPCPDRWHTLTRKEILDA